MLINDEKEYLPVLLSASLKVENDEKYCSLPYRCLLGIIMKKYTFYARTKTSFSS